MDVTVHSIPRACDCCEALAVSCAQMNLQWCSLGVHEIISTCGHTSIATVCTNKHKRTYAKTKCISVECAVSSHMHWSVRMVLLAIPEVVLLQEE